MNLKKTALALVAFAQIASMTAHAAIEVQNIRENMENQARREEVIAARRAVDQAATANNGVRVEQLIRESFARRTGGTNRSSQLIRSLIEGVTHTEIQSVLGINQGRINGHEIFGKIVEKNNSIEALLQRNDLGDATRSRLAEQQVLLAGAVRALTNVNYATSMSLFATKDAARQQTLTVLSNILSTVANQVESMDSAQIRSYYRVLGRLNQRMQGAAADVQPDVVLRDIFRDLYGDQAEQKMRDMTDCE